MNKSCIRQRLPMNQHEQGVAEEVGILPVVEAELHLVKVGGQVLRADLVVAPDDPALEEAPDTLDRVRMHVGADILVRGVVDLPWRVSSSPIPW